jgi:hypothetical protein
MVRRIGVIFLSMSLILGAVAAHCPAVQIIQDSSLSDEGWRELSYIPLPQEYKDYKWRAGFDFAQLRDVVIPGLKRGQTVMFVGLAISMSMLCAAAVKWFAAKLFGEAAVVAGQQATHWDKLRGGAEAATGSGVGTGAAFGVEKGLGKVLGLIGINLEWPQTVTDQVRFLETELGISDYYVFGAAKAWVSEVTLPLGTRMELRIGSSYDYYNMGYPPGEFRIIYDSWPRVLRWKTPDLDFEKLDARVWERDITGKLQPTTVRRVFPYEVVDGKIFPFTREGKPSGLSVQPDTPKKGGKIVGKVSLKYLPQLGESGLREVHVCSPVNEGVWAKKLDDYAFAIVTNKRTVSPTPSKEKLNVGEELIVSVKIDGFHPAEATMRASDGKVYPWEDWAGAILRGASLKGAGITETDMKHERERTLLKGTPQEPGKVKLVLSTRDGPVVWEVATVEKEVKPEEVVEEVVEEKKERAQVTATIQEVVKTPVGWYYQVVIGVEGVRASFTRREDWERYPDETHHYPDHWKSPLILKAGEKIVVAVQVVRFDRPVHDLIEHRIVWYGVDENHNEIELESVFSPSEIGYKD